jgi:leader peptidase (prepilin peptidase) / N-methyltransferase
VRVPADWLAAVAAPFAGSLMSVLIRRLPRDQPELWGRSACEHCGHALSPAELVPLLSYAVLRGRCRACRARIAPAHVAVELAALVVALLALAAGLRGPELWECCALGWTLLTLAWLDWDNFWLPDVLSLPLLVAGLADAWWQAPWALTDRALGAVAGYAAFRALSFAYLRLRGREGLGEGDAKLLAAGGAWLGWQALPDVVLLAALVGIAGVVVARLRGKALASGSALPFGTMLSAAIWAIWLAQNI